VRSSCASSTRTGHPLADEAVVTDHPERSRYEIHLGDELAGVATYARHGGRVDVLHTEIDPAFGGHGLGAVLVKGMLDDLRRRGLRITPTCPFTAAYLRDHPEEDDLIDDEHRGSFDS
jgi:predicted GNAT family acetyltransferase